MRKNGYHNHDDLVQVLEKLPCARVSYEEWLKIGMGLKSVGLPVSVWDNWSRTDSVRYHEGECQKKWRGFNGQGVSSGTIIEIAKRYGHDPNKECQGDDGNELLDWDSTFEYVPDPSDQETTDKDLTPPTEEEGTEAIQLRPLPKPGEVFHDGEFRPSREFSKYIMAVFSPDDVVNYVPRSFWNEKRKKYDPLPSLANAVTMTAQELVDLLDKSDKELPPELRSKIPEAGAWIRINPIKPDTVTRKKPNEAVRDEDIAGYRYALVECDDLPPEEQFSRIKWLDLPVAIMVHSGGRSIHAIVKIDAKDEAEYTERVDFLFNYCLSKGLKMDKGNKNESRLSRVPGVMRGDKPQYIVEFASGKASWLEWRKAVDPDAEEVKKAEEEAKKAEEAEKAKKEEADDIPCYNLWDVLKNPLPEEPTDLIKGVLKKGAMMLVQSEPKAGKSFLMIEVARSLATGSKWLVHECSKSNVMLLNMELKEDNYNRRCKAVMDKLGMPPEGSNNGKFIVSSLQGQETDIEVIKEKLISAIKKNRIDVLIIDPLYKISNRDENSANEMGFVFKTIRAIMKETGCACIIVHHHPKTSTFYTPQNRGSGSGVIVRDADAIIDLSEIRTPKGTEPDYVKDARKSILKQRKLDYMTRELHACLGEDWMDTINAQGTDSAELLIEKAKDHLTDEQLDEIYQKLFEIDVAVSSMTAWLVSYSLREFRTPQPIPVWFDYPIHTIDETGMLTLENSSNAQPTKEKTKTPSAEDKKNQVLSDAFTQAEKDGDFSLDHVLELYNTCAGPKGVKPVKDLRSIIDRASKVGYEYRNAQKDFVKADYSSTNEEIPNDLLN
jgi:RecA-family ATPase